MKGEIIHHTFMAHFITLIGFCKGSKESCVYNDFSYHHNNIIDSEIEIFFTFTQQNIYLKA